MLYYYIHDNWVIAWPGWSRPTCWSGDCGIRSRYQLLQGADNIISLCVFSNSITNSDLNRIVLDSICSTLYQWKQRLSVYCDQFRFVCNIVFLFYRSFRLFIWFVFLRILDAVTHLTEEQEWAGNGSMVNHFLFIKS